MGLQQRARDVQRGQQQLRLQVFIDVVQSSHIRRSIADHKIRFLATKASNDLLRRRVAFGIDQEPKTMRPFPRAVPFAPERRENPASYM